MQRSEIAERVLLLEWTFSAECKVKGFYEFLRALSTESPKLMIKSLSVKPNHAKDPSGVLLNGTLCLLCFIPEEGEASTEGEGEYE